LIARMGEIAEQLKARTMWFALDVCELIKQLAYSEPSETVRRQLTRPQRQLPSTIALHAAPGRTRSTRRGLALLTKKRTKA
jgi:hypothetical protein